MTRGPAFDVRSDWRGRAVINPFELDATELVDLFEQRAPLAIDNWNDIGPEEYTRAFTAARTMGYDVVGDLYAGLLEVLNERGATEVDYAERVLPILRDKGWLPQLDDAALATRVQLIYDTNLRTAQAVGQWDRIQTVKVALPYLLGVTARDSRVRHPPKDRRHDHRAFEGILLPVDHPFWQLYFPPLGFRCFLPGTRIEGAVKAAIRRWHDGPAVELRMASGRKLSVTPDHPILTGRGWVLAEHVRKGDDCLGRRRKVDSPVVHAVNDDNSPTLAENLFDAMRNNALAARKGASLKLDGQAQGGDGEVDIVFADAELAEECVSQMWREQILQRAAFRADNTLRRLGAIEGSVRESQARDTREAGDFGFANAKLGRDSAHGSHWVRGEVAESGLQRVVASAGSLPSFTALPLDATRRLFNGLPLERFGLASIADDDVLFDQLAREASAADSGLFGELLHAHAAVIERDEVVEVRQFDFSGHVYDFQTEEGILAASEIIVHNCRCSVVQMTRAQVARKALSFTTELELAERTRRLGPPWGFNPGGNPLAGVEASAEQSNDARLEGAPPISTQLERARGRMAWTDLTKGAAAEALDALLANLFA